MISFSNMWSLAAFVLGIVGKCLVFKKAGVQWWRAIIPIYSEWVLLKLINRGKLFVPYIIANVAMYGVGIWLIYEFFAILGGAIKTNIFSTVVGAQDVILENFASILICLLLMLVSAIALFCIRVFSSIGLGNAFKLPSWMVVILVLFPEIAMFVLGIADQYQPEWFVKNVAKQIEHFEDFASADSWADMSGGDNNV